jgi:hypothetical protein
MEKIICLINNNNNGHAIGIRIKTRHAYKKNGNDNVVNEIPNNPNEKSSIYRSCN